MSAIGMGTNVKVVAGKSAGVRGVVFWQGDNKFGDGKRFGVKDASGTAHWVDQDHVEIDTEAPEAPAVDKQDQTEPPHDKGTAVKVVSGEAEGAEGEIFWIGESKFRGGSRYGIKDEEGQTHWVDHDEVEVV